MTGGRQLYARAAWDAASVAVEHLFGEPPPSGPAKRGSFSDLAPGWRRKIAAYTAAVSLDAGVKPLLDASGMTRRRLREVLTEMEDRRDATAIDELLDLVEREARRVMQDPRPSRRALQAARHGDNGRRGRAVQLARRGDAA